MAVTDVERIGGWQQTTRDRVTTAVAAEWMGAHPQYPITDTDLAKTVKQLLTEVFQTGRQRARTPLSEHARTLLSDVGADTAAFAAARTYSTGADMPAEHARTFGALAERIAPLAAAIQLARIPVTNAAVRAPGIEGGPHSIDRRVLRGFVVAEVKLRAVKIHAEIGAAESADTYLQWILADLTALAAGVVAAAGAKLARPSVLTDHGAQRLDAYARAHLARLSRAAHSYGQDADEVLGDTMLKLTTAFCGNPDLDADYSYARAALGNRATDIARAARHRQANEFSDEAEVAATARDHEGASLVDAVDLVVRMVLKAAESLADTDAASERALARLALLRYFLIDPEIVDPRRARLGAHVMALSAPDGRDKDEEMVTGLGTVAAGLSHDRRVAGRICTLAVRTLRAR